MRETSFKGKALGGYKNIAEGEWIEGGLFYTDNEYGTVCYIATSYLSADRDEPMTVVAYEVDPETVCQYTGLTDKNGRKIFEGDIASFDYELNDWGKVAKILFEDGEYRYRAVTNSPELYNCRICGENDRCEVIGNIFDNPDLLKE